MQRNRKMLRRQAAFVRSRREAVIGRTHLVAENQMCFVAALADAFETIDGMTVILRRQAKQRS
jgi:hypothetical protein